MARRYKARKSMFDGLPDRVIKAHYPTMGSEFCRRAIRRKTGVDFTNTQIGCRAAHLGVKMTREAHSRQIKIAARAASARSAQIRQQKKRRLKEIAERGGIPDPNPHHNTKSGAWKDIRPSLFDLSITIYAWCSVPWGPATKPPSGAAFFMGDPSYG